MITVRDKGYGKLMTMLRRAILDDTEVTVGIHEDEGASYGGLSVQEVAAFHEFGTATIPARSFVRGFVEDQRDKSIKLLGKALKAGIKKRDIEGQLKKAAVVLAGRMKKRITKGLAPPLKLRDGKPLIDTGQLVNSIHGKVNGE